MIELIRAIFLGICVFFTARCILDYTVYILKFIERMNMDVYDATVEKTYRNVVRDIIWDVCGLVGYSFISDFFLYSPYN